MRAAASGGLTYMASLTPPSSGVNKTSFSTKTRDGEAEIELRWHSKRRAHLPARGSNGIRHALRMTLSSRGHSDLLA